MLFQLEEQIILSLSTGIFESFQFSCWETLLLEFVAIFTTSQEKENVSYM